MRAQVKAGWTGFFERAWFAPVLLSIQPVLHLFSINIAELSFSEILRPLLIALLLGLMVLGMTFLFFRDWRRASLVASLFLVLFFLFGDIAAWISGVFLLGPARSNLETLAFVTVVMAIWIWLVQKQIRDVASVNRYFNLLAVLFLLNTGVGMGNYLFENGLSCAAQQSVQAVAVEPVDNQPDIYYIILDGYGRQDILQELYEFDNSSFLSELSTRGFYVAQASSSNYIQTMLSLSSSLNMEYLQTLKTNGTKVEKRRDLVNLVESNKVRNLLAQHGYQVISFHNEYKATISSAEIYYDDAQSGFAYPVTAFESILIDHSMARVLAHVPALNKALIEMPYDTHRQHIIFTFNKLQEVPALEGNYFVYAHIIAPHPPFVFDEEGQVVNHDKPFTLNDANYYIRDHSQKNYIAGYRRQMQYINRLVLETVDAILTRSTVPPIIILQGDHGPGAYLHWGSLEQTIPAERFGILNAYYFPSQNYTHLYPSISPVNSFRVLFDQFFGADYPLLPDRHYYSSWSYPFDFTEVIDVSLP
ncbi:MAG TPA: sulfatase-like hydrolase/transferase [Anaerolineales bacterium]|nr:sulfatase-like hydrolase/transferase [Anaerolineales bacterium]